MKKSGVIKRKPRISYGAYRTYGRRAETLKRIQIENNVNFNYDNFENYFFFSPGSYIIRARYFCPVF